MISETEQAVLEIGCGAWFITAASLVVLLGFFVVQRILYERPLAGSPTFIAALALGVFGAASAIRAGLAWYRFSHGDFDGSAFITNWWPWFEVSIIMNALGAAVAVYILAPGYRVCLAIVNIFAAFAIPTAFWYF